MIVSVHGPFVYGEVESQSGLSTWAFSVDFNDYGYITGNYWATSENADSNIPARIGELISQAVVSNMNSDSYSRSREQNYEDIDWEDVASAEAETSSAPFQQHPKKKRLKFRTVIIIALILCVVGISAYNYWINSKLIPVGFSSSDLIGEHYLDVIDSLSAAGFTQIHVNELKGK